jgi:hypothetical protein
MLKATGNKNMQVQHYANIGELSQEIGLEFQSILDDDAEIYFESMPPSEKAALVKQYEIERLQVAHLENYTVSIEGELRAFPSHQVNDEVFAYAVWLNIKHGLFAHSAVAVSLYKYGCKLLAGLTDGGKVRELEKMLKAVSVHEIPPPKKAGPKPGGHKTEKALLRPKWVGVSEAARVLGLQRSTILKWHKAGRVVLPVGGHTRTYQLHRGALGQVNLTLLQHIAQHKRSLPGPGRRLGNAPGRELVAAAVRAHGSPAQAAEYSRVCKALSLLEGVKQGPLLHAARRHLNRLILRKRQTSGSSR